MKGFTIFFAMLVAGLALAVGLAIFDLTIRELDLSATVTQSQYATYAADTAAECALYWDVKCTSDSNLACTCTDRDDSTGICLKGTAFATSTVSDLPPSGDTGILCNRIDIERAAADAGTWPAEKKADQATTTFTVSFLPQQPYCALVNVYKTQNGLVTKVDAHGYNTCAGNGVLQLEREFLYGPY